MRRYMGTRHATIHQTQDAAIFYRRVRTPVIASHLTASSLHLKTAYTLRMATNRFSWPNCTFNEFPSPFGRKGAQLNTQNGHEYN